MYVDLSTYTHTHIYIYIYIHACVQGFNDMYIHIYMYTSVPLAANRFFISLSVHMYICMSMHLTVYIHRKKVYVCMRACMHACMYVCVCVFAHASVRPLRTTKLFGEQLKDRIRRWLGGGHGIEVTLRGSQGFTGSRRGLGFRSLGLEFKFTGLVEGLRFVCSLSLLVACSCRS